MQKEGGSLFARNFHLECLNALDETAIEDAYLFFTDNVRELRWEANTLAMLYFIALLILMQASELPDPRRSSGGVVMFCIWALLQTLQFLSQSLGVLFVFLAYTSMKEHFGHCLVRWNSDGIAYLDLTSLLTSVWLPSVLQKFLAIKTVLLTTYNGLRSVGFDRTSRIVDWMHILFDMLFAIAGIFSLCSFVVTLSVFFGFYLFPIPLAATCTLPVLLGVAATLPSAGLAAVRRCRICCCPWWSAGRGTEEDAEATTNAHKVEAVDWVWRGTMFSVFRKEALVQSRCAVPPFAVLGTLSMAMAPWLMTSTWLTWYTYGAPTGTDDITSNVFGEIMVFAFASLQRGIRFPSVFDPTELLATLNLAELLETLEELGSELALPHVLLQRSRTWSLLGVIVGVVKGAISILEKILSTEWCPCGVPWDTAKVRDGCLTAEEIRSRGWSVGHAQAAGFTNTELVAAGFSEEEVDSLYPEWRRSRDD